jgi:large subunit ribosomal protein L4
VGIEKMKIPVYNLEGKEIEKLQVSDSVFGLSANDDLVHQIAVSEMANKRQVLAHTKTRSERAGSGRKPWKQKGTGRARVGSVRTPVWRKGGVVFGPRLDRNFKKKINKKMNAKAIATVLSRKLRDKEIYVVEKLELPKKKTREIARVLNNLKLTSKTMVSFSGKEKDFIITTRNIKNAENILTSQLNVLDMLSNKNLLMSKESIKYLDEKYKK